MTLKADMQKAIDANLPAEVSKTLQERLALADQLESRVRILESKLADAEHRAKRTYQLDDLKKKIDSDNHDLAERERDLKQEGQLNDIRIQCAEDRRQDTWRMLEMLLANRTVRETAQHGIAVGQGDLVQREYVNGGETAVPVRCCDSVQQVTNTTEREEG